jgi:hypothetical protein
MKKPKYKLQYVASVGIADNKINKQQELVLKFSA